MVSLRFWYLALLCWPVQLAAQPTIGFTFSGGGAKGLAHIGVLLELEKAGIYPDFISGTSMGSIVGGLYASGYSAEELAEFATSLRWEDYFNDASDRADIPIEERQRSDRYQLSLPFEDGKLVLPQGLLRGRRIQTLLSLSTLPAHGITHFDSLPYPFRAVATDLESGEAYVFDRGPLRQALRASMAIPSVFAPVTGLDNELLVDGLVVRNLPVSDAQAMGADFIIAVDVGAPLYTRDELSSPISIVTQTSSFISANSLSEQRNLADCVIEPQLEPFNTLSYGAADSLIERGAVAARRILPDLLRQLDSIGVELPLRAPAFEPVQLDSFKLTGIQVEADQAATASILRRLLDLPTEGMIARKQLERQISLLYGTGFFDLIDFDLRPTEGGRELLINAQSLSPWRARFSLNYDSDFDIALLANLSGRHVGLPGSLLALDLKISPNPAAQLEYLVYTRSKPRLGLRLLTGASFYPGRTYEAGEVSGEFSFHDYRLQASGLMSLGNNRSLEAGLRLFRLSRNPRFLRPGEATEVRTEVALGARLIRDTYDRTFYPREGSFTIIDIQRALDGRLRSELDEQPQPTQVLGLNWRILARVEKVFPLGSDISFLGRIRGGLLNGPGNSLTNSLYLGRQITNDLAFSEFYGYRYMELAADAYAMAGFDLRLELSSDLFLTLGYEYGRYALSEDRILQTGRFLEFTPGHEQGIIQGLGLELGTITIAGPIQAGTQYRPDDGEWIFWLHGGYYF